MQTGAGQLAELYLDSDRAAARLSCPAELVPAPGQYLLAHDASDSPLPVPIFAAGAAPGGFLTAPPLPASWTPGVPLHLRGPLGRGFSLPVSARLVALIALDDSPARLLALLPPALAQGAAVTLVCGSPPQELPAEVEVQPLAALEDVCTWADYLAVDVERASLPGLRVRLGWSDQLKARAERNWIAEAQVLVRTPMPCGGVAECGVCAVLTHHGWAMACKDGPVFDLSELRRLIPDTE